MRWSYECPDRGRDGRDNGGEAVRRGRRACLAGRKRASGCSGDGAAASPGDDHAVRLRVPAGHTVTHAVPDEAWATQKSRLSSKNPVLAVSRADALYDSLMAARTDNR